MRTKIVVVGSSNTDMVVQSAHLPKPGETVLGGKFVMNPGGKGANQAVAAARLGGEVCFIARVGDDLFGQEAIRGFQSHGINTEHVVVDSVSPSGVALIMVDEAGENCISVALGANAAMQKEDLDKARNDIKQAAFVLVQLEIPLEVVEHLVSIAQEDDVKVILNPAPAQSLSESLLGSLYLITPNQSEAELLTGVKVHDEVSARKAALHLIDKGLSIVIITMGSKGAYVLGQGVDQLIPSIQVKVVDTTAAGDTFNGALVVGLTEGMPLIDAVIFANKAAAFSVTKLGAQASAPTVKDFD
jgi:ribokinase